MGNMKNVKVESKISSLFLAVFVHCKISDGRVTILYGFMCRIRFQTMYRKKLRAIQN